MLVQMFEREDGTGHGRDAVACDLHFVSALVSAFDRGIDTVFRLHSRDQDVRDPHFFHESVQIGMEESRKIGIVHHPVVGELFELGVESPARGSFDQPPFDLLGMADQNDGTPAEWAVLIRAATLSRISG